jgi:hypothetical protein
VLYGVKKEGVLKMQDVRWHWVLPAIFLPMLLVLTLVGCATSTLSEQTAPPGEPLQTTEAVEPETARYYDFEDVPVPAEMELKTDRSFVFQTTEFAAGLLAFSGRVELSSLISFFRIKLPDDGWRFLSSIKSPKTILFFQKANRLCIITIISKAFTTDAEILVAQGFSDI